MTMLNLCLHINVQPWPINLRHEDEEFSWRRVALFKSGFSVGAPPEPYPVGTDLKVVLKGTYVMKGYVRSHVPR